MNNKLLGKFLKVFFVAFGGALLVIVIGTYMASLVSKSNIATQVKSNDFSNKPSVTKATDEDALTNKKMTTVALFGVAGDSVKTDVNMLIFFNHETFNVDVISIPADTRVKIPDPVFEQIKSERADAEQIVKLNEVPTMVKSGLNETSVAVLEKSLGVNVDYFVNMNMEAFRKAVDIVGDVTVNVPMDMEYTDNSAELYINLKAGENTLNGAQAEQLVRFISGYSNGEIGRIDTQKSFMKAFLKQLLNKKNRVNSINILTEVLHYVQTDFDTVMDYLVYADKVNEENFRFHTLPGKPEEDRGYYIYDLDKTKDLIGKILNNEEILPEVIIEVKELPISIQNGTNIAGFAGRTAEKLTNLGYDVKEITNYTDNGIEKTRIIVANELVFDELAPYFNNPEMRINEELDNSEYKIIIVLGTADNDAN